jgi:hypothetical protein
MDLQPIAVAAEADKRGDLVPVEGFDCDSEAVFGVDFVFRREGVVEEFGPAFFLEGGEDEFLVGGGDAVAFDDLAGVAEFAVEGIPGRSLCDRGTRG